MSSEAAITAAAGEPPARGMDRVPSPVLVVGGITSVQFGNALASQLFDRIGPGGAALLRLAFATVVLLALWRPRPWRYTRRELLLSALFGLILAGMNVSFYHAVKRLPLGLAVTIEFLGPLAVAIAGSRRRLDLVWAALAAVGILSLSHGGGHGLNLLGVIFDLVAAAMWAAYIIVNARLGQASEGGGGLALAMAVATLAALPVGAAEAGGSLFGGHALLLGAVVGLLSSAIPYSLELEALRRIAVNVFGVLMSLEPGVAAVAGFLVLGQQLSAREIAGIVLVAAASTGSSLMSRRAPVPA